MRKVVDTNFLKSDKLREYLADSTNIAVIPDFAVKETLKGRDPSSIYRQFQGLAEYPSQVIALKTTRAVSGLRSRRGRGLQRRLIDKDQTSGFKLFCDKLEQAKNGDEVVRKQLAHKCDLAIEELDQIASAQNTFAANLAEHAKNYTDAELKILRKGEPITPELFAKITEQIQKLAVFLFAAHPYFKKPPRLKQLPNAFIFRYAVAGYVVALCCLKDGGPGRASVENIRNQLVDAMFAAYATYFDGFLSDDQKANELYETTCDLLKIFHREIQTTTRAISGAVDADLHVTGSAVERE
jgi:hypothetical protein